MCVCVCVCVCMCVKFRNIHKYFLNVKAIGFLMNYIISCQDNIHSAKHMQYKFMTILTDFEPYVPKLFIDIKMSIGLHSGGNVSTLSHHHSCALH